MDPTGKAAGQPGAKLDAGKPMADLVGDFASALLAVAEVATFGAKKYSLKGWLEVPNGVQRYADAKMRHYLKRHRGEETDPDSGLSHRAHEVWNALAELELYLRGKDR